MSTPTSETRPRPALNKSETEFPQAAVLGYSVDLAPKSTCLKACIHALQAGQAQHVVTLNPEMMIYAKRDEAYKGILMTADWRIPDGVGIIWALQRQGIQHVARMPGIEFSESLLEAAAQNGLKVAFIGGEESINAAAAEAMRQKYPGLDIAYTHHGFFPAGSDEETSIAKACAGSGAQIVMLALGFPRQEFWIRQFQKQFPHATLMLGVGGSFDVWSGVKKRAPKLFRALNLEWLYRISSEPWRIQRVSKTLPEYLVKAVLLKHNSL